MLEVDKINQYYGGSHILRNVSFDVPAGKCTTLLGRNGVGKTTLLRCLMGLVPVRSGDIRLDAAAITALPPHARASRGLGYVPQGRDIFPRLTVLENLQMGLATQKKGVGIPAFVYEMFPVLKDMLSRRGGDLSGGQQQQLAIGRALALRPRLLILDEPTKASNRRSSRTSSVRSGNSRRAVRWRFCWSSSTRLRQVACRPLRRHVARQVVARGWAQRWTRQRARAACG
jgi:urea transport system ATP-binding protein